MSVELGKFIESCQVTLAESLSTAFVRCGFWLDLRKVPSTEGIPLLVLHIDNLGLEVLVFAMSVRLEFFHPGH